MVQPSSARKNIWVAASDGDIDRVRYLIETEGMSPNVKDSNSYSPMHAAASYHHFDLLIYLISVGGDINLADDEGETPLFTVESVDAARWLIAHGADPDLTNEEGQNAADYHEDDHPEISQYLRSLAPDQAGDSIGAASGTDSGLGIPVAESAVDAFTSSQADSLIAETQRIVREAEAAGEDPEARLRDAVQRAVERGMRYGGELGAQADEADEARKRARGDGDGDGDGPVNGS